jgi:Amt family ammonium transporter
MGYHDFAGSGAIHFLGATGALVITMFLRPRKGRFDKRFEHHFEPSNILFISLATLSLYVCWLFFNAGGTLAISGDSKYIIGRAASNTMLAGASGAITVTFLNYYLNKGTSKQWSLDMMSNGNLAGLVAITG